MIAFEDVTKQYPDGTVAVDGLNLQVPEGTLTVFVGPSGCGKTTAMRMINRMIEPTSGTLTVGGDDVTKVDPVKLRLRHRRRRLGRSGPRPERPVGGPRPGAPSSAPASDHRGW